jgi:hypothetical protein
MRRHVRPTKKAPDCSGAPVRGGRRRASRRAPRSNRIAPQLEAEIRTRTGFDLLALLRRCRAPSPPAVAPAIGLEGLNCCSAPPSPAPRPPASPTRPAAIGARRCGPGRVEGIRGYGTLVFRVRGSSRGFSSDDIAEEPLRRSVCKCVAVPRAEQRVAEGIARTLRSLKAGGLTIPPDMSNMG